VQNDLCKDRKASERAQRLPLLPQQPVKHGKPYGQLGRGAEHREARAQQAVRPARGVGDGRPDPERAVGDEEVVQQEPDPQWYVGVRERDL
jgi:hypothetical protein